MKSENCIKCGTEIVPLYPELNGNREKGMWANGVIDKIAANYGSKFDGGVFLIGICDKCIEDNLEKIGNYMN